MATLFQFHIDRRDQIAVIDYQSLFGDLSEAGLDNWQDSLTTLLNDRFADGTHGDLQQWQAILKSLPVPENVTLDLRADSPGGNCAAFSAADRLSVRGQLMQLKPWRKGPFNLCGVSIDSEWRSDLKWSRVVDAIAPLAGKTVLDVGCGNGYYALRMIGAGASMVVGVDPTLLFVCQFLAIQKLLRITRVHVLPVRLHELPIPAPIFDATFSMGVLYHQRNPHDHLAQLLSTLRPAGELVLETLVVPGDDLTVVEPGERYARMRNVWHLPTVPALVGWLRDAGFENVRIADVSVTTSVEQRSTEWMQFESLAEALDVNDPSLTIEGLPAPMRAVAICNAPA